MKNTFIIIIKIIQSCGGVIREYELLKLVEKEHPDFFKSLGETPSLYKKHYYLFYHLYQLRSELLKTNQSLIISVIKISLVELSDTKNQLAETDALAKFYSDFNNINLSDDEVSVMLNQFWEKYLAIDKKVEALEILGLDDVDGLSKSQLSKSEITKRYKQLANRYHPDKGGDDEKFTKIKAAKDQLLKLVK